MAVTFLLAVLGINAFYFDPNAKRTRTKTFRFLEVRFWSKGFRRTRGLLNRIPLVRRMNPWLFRRSTRPAGTRMPTTSSNSSG